jgi:hypothetical protein
MRKEWRQKKMGWKGKKGEWKEKWAKKGFRGEGPEGREDKLYGRKDGHELYE